MIRLALALALMLGAAAAMAQDWIDLLDIPLMPGLAVVADSEAVFETAEGRLIAVTAAGAVAPADVRRYYASALDGLGWRSAGGTLIRDGERLTLEITRDGGTSVIAFQLAPAGR